MIRAKNYETLSNLSKFCLEYFGLFFSRTRRSF